MALRWYILHVYSGFEAKVSESILERAEKQNIRDKFDQILVPSEEVVEMKKGEKVSTERRFYPGYILIRMEMTDEAWHLVKDTPKVSDFLGSGSRPTPVPNKEAERVLERMKEGAEKPKMSIAFEVGEQVRVSDGPFASFNGVVEEIDEERARLKVSVTIFGRATPVELEFSQVEKSTD